MNNKIKINFCDWHSKFDKNNNDYINILRQHYAVEISETPDFLFYSCFGIEHLNYEDCVKIFFTGEDVLPNFNECDYAAAFDYMEFGNRYFHKGVITGRAICNRAEVDERLFNRKFCNFIYSNATSGEGAILRQEFCKKLMAYKHVDCPGKVLNNMSAEDLEPRSGDWIKSKREFLKKYKFTIAFENSLSNGYTTEKLVDPFLGYSIPIYWGNPLVTKDFNPKAFINCNDYDNDFDAIIERIKELDDNPDKYLAMLSENPMQSDYDFDKRAKFEQWLINIIESGNKPFTKDPHKRSTIPYLLEKNKHQLDNSAISRIDISETATIHHNFSINNSTPAGWMEKNGKFGYVLEQVGKLIDKKISILDDTTITISLRGPDKRDESGQIIENWVDFTKVSINGKNIISTVTPVWHNRPFIYTVDVKKGDILELHAEWKKHEVYQVQNNIQSVDAEIQPRGANENRYNLRESIEWTNTWVEDAPNVNKKRILIIGDSVAREIRSKMNTMLNEYAVDYIGSSASFEDNALYTTCESFFTSNKIYKYALILLNIGNQHGYYLNTKSNEESRKSYVRGCRLFFEYAKKHCPIVSLLTATPNAQIENPKLLNDERNSEIKCRNELQQDIAKELNIPIIDLYSFALDKKFEFKDAKHFTAEAQPQFAEYIISELKTKGLITNE